MGFREGIRRKRIDCKGSDFITDELIQLPVNSPGRWLRPLHGAAAC